MDSLGIWSVIPPVLTITLALIFKDVIFALVAGILSGTLILGFSQASSFSPGGCFYAICSAFAGLADKVAGSLTDPWNIRIILFCALLGGFVVLMTSTGSIRSFGEWAAGKLKTRTGTLLFTFFFGILIFIDDYFNSLSVGTAMRPVTDKKNFSRAKLANILDTTETPVCIIAPISSWFVTVVSTLRKTGGLEKFEGINEFGFFVRLIPYNLYVMLTLLMVLLIILLKWDFGPMFRSEKRAADGFGLYNENLYG